MALSSIGKPEKAIREATHRLNAVLRRESLVKAWDLLQERDENDNARGALPWTEAAIGELEEAHKSFPNDPSVRHHLAIARHARAWDYELSDDRTLSARAQTEWEAALEHWYVLAAAPEFWETQKQKLLSCRAEADTSVLDDARHNLVGDLLDVHVEFVRHYCELGQPERAAAHIEIVRHANIRRSLKMQLQGKIFDAMTGPVTAAKAAQEFDAALHPIELFLKLFPDNYLPALEMHATVCGAWVSGLSYKDDWDEILVVEKRAWPVAQLLADCDELVDNVTARNAFEELAAEFLSRARDRATSYHTAARDDTGRPGDRDRALESYEFALRWGRLGYPKSRTGTSVRELLPACLNNYAFCLHAKSVNLFNESHNPLTIIGEARQYCVSAVDALEEALRHDPGDSKVAENLSHLRGQLTQLDNMM